MPTECTSERFDFSRVESRRVEADFTGGAITSDTGAAAIEKTFVDLFIKAHGKKAPRQIILDLDATDDPLHGHQEGRFFHGLFKKSRSLELTGSGPIGCTCP